MSYDRFVDKNTASQTSEINNPVQFESNYDSAYTDGYESSSTNAIVTSEPQKNSKNSSLRSQNPAPAYYDTDKAIYEYEKIEFDEVPSIFCNFCQCFGNNRFMNLLCNVVLSSRWIAIVLVLVDAGLHVWATLLHTRCPAAYGTSWIGIVERYTVALEWYVCISGIYGILQTNRTLIFQYFIFNVYEFIFGLVAYSISLKKFNKFLSETLPKYPPYMNTIEKFNEFYKQHRENNPASFNDHDSCYLEISWGLYYKRIFLAIVFLAFFALCFILLRRSFFFDSRS